MIRDQQQAIIEHLKENYTNLYIYFQLTKDFTAFKNIDITKTSNNSTYRNRFKWVEIL